MQIEKRVDAEEARNERFDYSNPLLLCTLLLSAFFCLEVLAFVLRRPWFYFASWMGRS